MTNQTNTHQLTPFSFPAAKGGPLPKNWERAFGYAPTEKGYEPCPTCDNRGSWFVEVEEAKTLKGEQINIVWPTNTQQEFLVNRNHW